jgi:hypothetical protein
MRALISARARLKSFKNISLMTFSSRDSAAAVLFVSPRRRGGLSGAGVGLIVGTFFLVSLGIAADALGFRALPPLGLPVLDAGSRLRFLDETLAVALPPALGSPAAADFFPPEREARFRSVILFLGWDFAMFSL